MTGKAAPPSLMRLAVSLVREHGFVSVSAHKGCFPEPQSSHQGPSKLCQVMGFPDNAAHDGHQSDCRGNLQLFSVVWLHVFQPEMSWARYLQENVLQTRLSLQPRKNVSWKNACCKETPVTVERAAQPSAGCSLDSNRISRVPVMAPHIRMSVDPPHRPAHDPHFGWKCPGAQSRGPLTQLLTWKTRPREPSSTGCVSVIGDGW